MSPRPTIKLEVHEPWDAYQILSGQILCPIRCVEGGVYYLFKGEGENYLLLAPRYLGERIEDVYKGQRIHVNIGVVIDPRVLESDYFKLEQVVYFGIGTIEIES